MKLFNVILAMTKERGIGKGDKLAWDCKEEIGLFRKLTTNVESGLPEDKRSSKQPQHSVLICGRKTAETLPELKNRIVLVVGKEQEYKCIEEALYKASSIVSDETKNYKKIFIIGGGQIYDYVFQNLYRFIDNVYLSIMNTNYECTHFVSESFLDYHIVETFGYTEFVHYVLKRNSVESPDRIYFSLLSNVFINGMMKQGRNGGTKAMFFQTMSFDLKNGFPLLTTKRMFFRGIVEELLFFLRGDTDSKILEEKNVNIWKGNTSREFLDENGWNERKEGEMGPMYGWQWRRYGQVLEDKNIKEENDMLFQLINDIFCVKRGELSSGRRLLLTTFNPKQAREGVLYPCHSVIIQFNVEGEHIDVIGYNRSCDLFLGIPFNMAMLGLLLTIIGEIVGLKPRRMHMSLGDCHIYEKHLESAKEQLSRIAFSPCRLVTNISSIKDDTEHSEFCEYVKSLNISQFELRGYTSHPSIKTEMIA